jgi:hypothetical protein
MAAYPPTHIRIPKNHADFESKSVILFRILLEDPDVKKLGRSGQKQFGIDLIGYRKEDLKRPVGIQCKKKKPSEKLTAKEVRDEVKKALKYEPPIVEYIIVTTADDDRTLDQLAQQLTKDQRENGRKFRVEVWGWGTLEEFIDQHEEAKEAFDPGASPSVKAIKANLASITKNQSRQATAQQVAELSRKIDSQGGSLTGDQLPASVADKEIASEIRILLARRGFHEAKTVEEWARFAERVLTGDLVKASPAPRSDVLERAARSHARPEDVAKAKAFHAAALKCNRLLDTRFYDALLPAAEGDVERTLRALRKLATPEAKSAIFNQLFRTQGAGAALDWLVASQITITDLDAAGALNVLFQKVETDDFDGALKDAETLTAYQLDALPSLYAVRCSLLLASALPKDLKHLAFQGMPINPRELRFASTPQAATALTKARVDLDRALKALESLRIVEIRPFLEEMALWLRLEDKRTHDAAVEQIAEEIKDPAKTLRRVRLALSYSIPFNRDALMRSLVAQKKIGNWDVDERFAVFLLAFYSDDLCKTAEFFDSYGAELYSHDSLQKGLLLGIEVEVLARIGRFEDARERLGRHKGKWVDDAAAAHLEELIASVETGKEADRLRKLYEEKKDLNFLRLLVIALMKESDSHQLAVYAPILLQETNRVEDYDAAIKALYVDKQYSRVIELSKSYPELHRLEDDFRAFEGWAQFSLGNVLEAQKIARTLVDCRDDPNDRELDINTAIESGDWGRLQAIVQREAERASSLEPRLLVRLARLAFESGSLYVDKFRDAALANAQNDPAIFLAAYQLSVERGEEYQESRSHVWFQQAVVLSDAEGPVHQVKLRDIVDRTAGWNEKVGDIDRMLSEVKVPLYLAARGLNRQPVEFILGTALRNARISNPKEQFPVLAFAGNRPSDPLSGMRRAALDITALFTLDYLGLLQKTIDAFDTIVISPTTLGSLFFDRQAIRFHQPSLVAKATRIKRLLADGKLKVLKGEMTNAEKAVLQVDPDLQFLLDKARENQAVVVRSAPVHKLKSLLEEVADLSFYSDVMTDTRAALDLVRAKVVANIAEGAEAYLKQVDQGWATKPSITPKSTFYLDHLTVSYFDHVGILKPFVETVAEVYVTQDVESEADTILRAAELADRLLAAIDRIRSSLNGGLQEGHVVFSSRRRADGDDLNDNGDDRRLPSLDIMADLSGLDVVVCDDRFLNKDLFWTDGNHRIPCANTLDLIYALNDRGKISQQQKYEYLHKLREGGYHAVAIELPEILTELSRAPLDQHGVVETPELSAFRLNLTIAIRSRMLSPIEGQWTDLSRMVIHQAIRALWSSDSSLESILARADWLLAVMPNPFRLVSDPTDETGWAIAQQKTVTQLGIMLSPTAISPAYQRGYSEWIDQKLANQTRSYYPLILGEAIKVLATFFQRIVQQEDEIPRDVRRRFIIQLTDGLHKKIESELLESPGFAKSMGLNLTNLVTFDESLAVTVDTFVDALKAALAKKKSALITMRDGAKEKAKLQLVKRTSVAITVAGKKLGIADVDLLGSTRPVRVKAADRVFSSKPLTKAEENRWLALCKKGLSPSEFIKLNDDLRNTSEHLTLRLAAPQSLGERVLVPKDIAYYVRLVGAIPLRPLLDNASPLLAQQKHLLSKGDVGLTRVAHSSISQALIPFKQLKGVSFEELAKLLELNDPFALVFGFEVCRFKLSQGDKAAVAEGTKFLETLFADKSVLKSRCELFSACAIISTVAIRPIANAAKAPLDWFRLAALSHAGVLTDALRHIRKPADFLKWAWSQYSGVYWWHTVVDTQEEPKWVAEWLLPEGLNAELIGRCYQALISLPKDEQPREWTTILTKEVKGLKPRLRAFFPGPLDGFMVLSQGEGAKEARDEIRTLLNDRVSFGDAPGLILLAHSGAIDRELATEIVRLIEASDSELVSLETGYQVLNCGAYVASTTRDEQLAQIVISRCARMIGPDMKPDGFLRVLLLALRACSAYVGRSEYYRQVGVAATRFAYLASKGTSLEMSKSLEVLCHRDVRLMGALGRAMAVLEAQCLAGKED